MDFLLLVLPSICQAQDLLSDMNEMNCSQLRIFISHSSVFTIFVFMSVGLSPAQISGNDQSYNAKYK